RAVPPPSRETARSRRCARARPAPASPAAHRGKVVFRSWRLTWFVPRGIITAHRDIWQAVATSHERHSGSRHLPGHRARPGEPGRRLLRVPRRGSVLAAPAGPDPARARRNLAQAVLDTGARRLRARADRVVDR